jgi:uncharacterized membrane protein
MIFIALLALSLAWNALRYVNFDPKFGFLRLKQKAIETGLYLPAYYSHVLVGGIILVIGLFQIYPRWNLKWRSLHRVLGFCYVMGILFFAAPGGMVMSFFIGRGPFVLASFMVQGVLWFISTARAFSYIRRGDIQQHREWMWRSYALTLAAITLRVYIFFASYYVDLTSPQAYATIAWLSWIPNLVVAEIMIRKRRNLQPQTS